MIFFDIIILMIFVGVIFVYLKYIKIKYKLYIKEKDIDYKKISIITIKNEDSKRCNFLIIVVFIILLLTIIYFIYGIYNLIFDYTSIKSTSFTIILFLDFIFDYTSIKSTYFTIILFLDLICLVFIIGQIGKYQKKLNDSIYINFDKLVKQIDINLNYSHIPNEDFANFIEIANSENQKRIFDDKCMLVDFAVFTKMSSIQDKNYVWGIIDDKYILFDIEYHRCTVYLQKKNFDEEVEIIKNSKSNKQRNDNLVELDNVTFNNYICVKCLDKVKAYEVITADVVDSVNNFSNKISNDFRITFFKNSLLINFAVFSPVVFNGKILKIEDPYLYYEMFKFIIDLVKCF